MLIFYNSNRHFPSSQCSCNGKVCYAFKGTPYEMGYAHGTLMKENTTQFINAVWAYLEEQVVMYFILSYLI